MEKITAVPKRLKEEPLLEGVWEFRFRSHIGSVAEILPGIIYSSLSDRYHFRIEKLPTGDMPAALIDQDENLRYLPTVRLVADGYIIQVGHQMASLSVLKPYPGWTEFGKRIKELVNILENTRLISQPERFSLKYIDIIPGEKTTNPLRVDLSVGGSNTFDSITLRTEKKTGEFIHIVQIALPARAKIVNEEIIGLLLDTDIICQENFDSDFWKKFDSLLDRAHVMSRDLFFSLLTQETIEKLGPEY